MLSMGLQLATASQRDLIELANGDVLGGSLIASESAETILFQHPILGRLELPAAQVKILSGATPENATPVLVAESVAPAVAVAEAPAQPAVAPEPKPEVSEVVIRAELEPDKTVDAELKNGFSLSNWRQFLGIFPLLEFVLADHPLKGWSHRMSVGYRWNSGKFDSQQFVGRVQSTRQIDKISELRLNLLGEYAFYRDVNDNKVVTKDLFRAEFRFRRQWSDSWFIQSTNRYRREPTRNVAHDGSAAAGIGYRFLDTRQFKANIVPSITYNYLEAHPAAFESKDHVLATVFQDLNFYINEQWSLAQTFEYNRDFSDERGDFANLSVRLNTKLFKSISFVNRYEVIYDARSPASVDAYERRFLSELVIEF